MGLVHAGAQRASLRQRIAAVVAATFVFSVARLCRRSRLAGAGSRSHPALVRRRDVLPEGPQLHPDRRLGPERRNVQGLRVGPLLEVRGADRALLRPLGGLAELGKAPRPEQRLLSRRRPRQAQPRGLHELDLGREHRPSRRALVGEEGGAGEPSQVPGREFDGGGHWKNIKNPRFKWVGIGVRRDGTRTRLVTDFYSW